MTIYDVWKPAMLEEELARARVYMATGVCPDRSEPPAGDGKGIISCDIIGHFFRRLEIASGFRYFCQAIRRHWWWPFYFSIQFPARVVRYYLRKIQAGRWNATTI